MTKLPAITRRHVIIAAAGAATAGIGTIAGSKIACSGAARVAQANPLILAGMVASPKQAYAIGAAYASKTGRDYDFAAVLRLAPRLEEACRVSCEASGQALIEAAMRDDFAAGDIVIVDGWVLSKAEALICAFWVSLVDAV